MEEDMTDDRQQAEGSGSAFERAYRREEFSELVRLTIGLADWLFRSVRSGAASGGLLSTCLLWPAVVGAGEWEPSPQERQPDIPVLLQVVICEPDLLHCRDLIAERFVFADAAGCHNQLPAARAEAGRGGSAGREAIFARCRYSPAASRPVKRQAVEPSIVLSGFLARLFQRW